LKRLILNLMQFLIKYLFSPLFVSYINKNSVILGDSNELFGFKLTARKEFGETLNPEILENLRKYCYTNSKAGKKYNQFLYIVYYRSVVRRNVENPLDDFDVYIFTEEPSIARFVASNFPVKLLSGVELANTLLRVQTLSEDFTYLRGSKIVREVEIFRELNPKGREKFEALLYSNTARMYRKVLTEKLTTEKIDYYVAVQPSETEIVQLDELFSLNWEGALWIVLNLNDLTVLLKDRLSYIKEEEDRVFFNKRIKEYEKGNFPILGLWIYLATKQKDIPVDTIFAKLSVQPLAISYNIGDYIYKTPLRKRDIDYMLLKNTEYAAKLIPTNFRKFYKHREPKFYGRDKFGLYVCLDMFDKIYPNPHIGILGPTGSGKSATILDITKMALDIDLEKLYKRTYTPAEAKPKMYIRYFDKGFSGELFFRALKVNHFPVAFGALKESEMLFNPFDLKIRNTEDIVSAYNFFISLINTVLEIKIKDTLKGLEETILEKIFYAFVREPEKYSITAKTLKAKLIPQSYPNLLPIYRKIVEKVGEENIGEKTLFEIGKEYGMENLTKPTVLDALRIISQQGANPELGEEHKKIFRELELKLKTLKETPFGWFSFMEINAPEILYLDIDTLVNSPYFTPYTMAILRLLVDRDKYEKPRGMKALYIFDEVHTLFEIKSFRRYLQKLTLELRKFKIAIIFASQNPSHFPKDVLNNLNFHLLLSPLSIWNEYKQNINEFEAEEIYKKLLMKTFVGDITSGKTNAGNEENVKKGQGIIKAGTDEVFSIFFPWGKYESIFFNTSAEATSITLEDGTEIKKELLIGH
jgi:hypothetical protein